MFMGAKQQPELLVTDMDNPNWDYNSICVLSMIFLASILLLLESNVSAKAE